MKRKKRSEWTEQDYAQYEEILKERRRLYYLANKERIDAKCKKYALENKEKIRKLNHDLYLKKKQKQW